MRTRRSQSSSDPVPSPSREGHRPSSNLGVGHKSVLLHEAIQALSIQSDDIVVDATLGGAGHARHLAEKLGHKGVFIGFDLDHEAILRAEEALRKYPAEKHLCQANFRHMADKLAELGVTEVTKILFDLGMSSYQLNSNSGLPAEASAQAGRGFSFLRDEPLLMTYPEVKASPYNGAGADIDVRTGKPILTARIIVNEWEEENIATVLWGWGGERYSRRIARAIVEARALKRIRTSGELADIIEKAVPRTYRYGKIHPATRSFQALRIAVNDELSALQDGLRSGWRVLAHGGLMAVISFHSAEDRIVKHQFLEWERSGAAKRLTKKPTVPSAEEVKDNPRARSAKLRVIQKTA